MRILLFIQFLIFSFFSFSQINLISNPGFETFTACPSGSGQYHLATGWNNVNMNVGPGSWGTPDYYNTCGTGGTNPPATFAGTCSPQSGNAMMSVVIYNSPFPNFREYLATALTCSMLPGNTYTVSFWITNGTGIKSPWTIRNIGINFTTGPMTQSGFALVTATPQVEITTNVATTSWVQYTFTVNPTAPWTHMTFGSFRPDINNNATMTFSNPGGPASVYANYFVDNFAVIAPAANGTISLLPVVTQPTICLGNGSAHVVPSNTAVPISYTWFPGNYTTSAVSNLSPGVYTVAASYLSGCNPTTTTTQFTIFPTTSPSVNLFASSNTICAGGNVTLTANATGGNGGPYTYSWTSGSSSSISIVNQLSAGTTTYSLQVRDGINCLTQETISISYFSLPQFSIASQAICAPESATLIATGVNTYTWLPANSTGSIFVATPSVSSIYTVIGSNSSGCTSSQVINQIVNPTPTLNLAISNTLICPGDTILLNVSGASSYTWSNNSVGSSYTTNPITASSFSVIGSSLNCTASAQTSIVVKPAPIVIFDTYSITCASLGSATANISGGVGPFSYTWMPTNQGSTIATGLFPGTYTFSIFDSGTGCLTKATENFLPLVPLTGTVTATPSLVCPGDTTGIASIALAGGSNAQQYFWTDVNGIQTVASPTNLAAGINTVTVSDLITFCSVTHTFLISGPPNFSLNISASSPSVCLGDSISLSALISGGTPGYSYTWINKGLGQLLSVFETTAGEYTFSILSIDSRGCEIKDSIVLRFVENPTLTVASTTICPFEQSLLSASGAATYSWIGGPSTNTYSVNPLSTSVFSVVGTSSACSSMQTATVYLHPVPTPTIVSNSPICAGDTLRLFAFGGSSYHWVKGPSFNSTIQEIVFANSSLSLAGIYELTVTAITGCTASTSQSIIVNPLPIISASGATVCVGNSIQLVSNFVYGATYQWQGNNYFSNIQNPIISNASTNNAGTYTLTVFNDKGCKSSALAYVNVVNQNTLSVVGTNTVCENSSVTIVASGASEYVWQGPHSYYSTSSTVFIASVNANSAGIYTLNSINGPCTKTTTHLLTVLPLPNLSVLGNSLVCEGQPLTLTVVGANTCTWSGQSNFTSNSLQITIPNLNQSSAGMYFLSGSNSFGCKAKDSLRLEFLNAPTIVVSNATVCLGGMLTLTANGGISYQWRGPNNFVSNISNPVIPSVSNSNVGIYTVTSLGLNSCASTSTITVTTANLPLPLAEIKGSNKACLNGKVILEGNGGGTYTWSGPNNFKSNEKQIVFEVVDYLLAGIYTLSVGNSFNCITTATIPLNIYAPSVASIISKSLSACIPFCTEFTLIADENNSKISDIVYNIDGKNIRANLFKMCFNESGEYLITATFVDINSCSNSTTLNISAFEKPLADFKFLPEHPLAGIDRVQFYNLTNGASQTNWNWYLMGNDTAVSKLPNPEFIFEKDGDFPIALEVVNKWGCKDTIIKVVSIGEEFTLYVPNAFTPNGDGVNDVFLPKGVGVNEYELEIFDRWGARIFFSDNFLNGWDGFYKGQLCKVDNYAWKINIKSLTGKSKQFTGHVMIVR